MCLDLVCRVDHFRFLLRVDFLVRLALHSTDKRRHQPSGDGSENITREGRFVLSDWDGDVYGVGMKRILMVLFLICALFGLGCGSALRPSIQTAGTQRSDDELGRAFAERKSNVQVKGEGRVTRLLADDVSGSKHQRFIVRLASGQTVLVAHNIDVAPRVADLKEGDTVSFYGEYVWNDKGGTVHWTHHDPQGKHVAGWVKYKGRTYQ
jgi:hypothetical protein